MESKYRYDQPPLMENEESFKQWRKSILLWSTVTDIPKEKQAIAVVLTLKGKARKTALEINTGDLTNDDGIKILLNKLDRVLNIDSMAIYKEFKKFDLLKKNCFETSKTYVKNFNALCDRLREVGIVIPEDFLILKLLFGAQLSNTQVQDILGGMEKGNRESAIMNLLLYDIKPFQFKPKAFQFKSNGTPIELRTVLTATSTIKNKSEIFKSSSVSDPKACSKFTFNPDPFKFSSLKDDKLSKGQQPHARTATKSTEIFVNTETVQGVFPGKVQSKTPSNSESTHAKIVSEKPKTVIDSAENKSSVPGPFTFSLPKSLFANLDLVGKTSAKQPQQIDSKLANTQYQDTKLLTSAQVSAEQSKGNALKNTPPSRAVSTNFDHPEAEVDVHFEPVVRLPDKVELTTGEEGEQAIFQNRGKLFAYHRETKQWKERGVGDVKILQDLETCRVRVIMRREQVFKVCLNHFLQPESKLSFKEKNSSRTLMWSSKDFTDTDKHDGEDLHFSLRFNDTAISSSFKRTWEDGIEAAVSRTLLDPDPVLLNVSETRRGVTNLGSFVKTPTTPKSLVKQSLFSLANYPSPFDVIRKIGPVNVMGFVFGITSDKIKKRSTTTNEKFTFDVSKISFNFDSSSSNVLKTNLNSGHSFGTINKDYQGMPTQKLFHVDVNVNKTKSLPIVEKNDDKLSKVQHPQTNEEAASTDEQTTPSIPVQSNQPECDKSAQSLSNDSQQNSSENKWVFGSDIPNQASSGFASFAAMSSGVENVGFKKDPGFQFPGAEQVKFQSQNTDETDENDPSSYECDAQFKPVLDEPPPLIEVKTGEEGEEVLFKERCTLYRYDKGTKQWKERGRGDIKILYNDQHNIHRVVMRREQIHKVCANHVINDTTNPEPHLGSLKTCSYFAMDYTEGTTPTAERFAVRFKTEELCKSYTDKIEEIKVNQKSQM